MMKIAALVIVVFTASSAQAQGITCNQVREYAASMGVGQLRAMAAQFGVTASQQARAMRCLNAQRPKRASR